MQEEAHLWGMEIKGVTRDFYLGVFIGDQAAETEWPTEKVRGWTTSVETMVGVVHQTSADRIHWYEKLLPKGVIFCIARHPRSWQEHLPSRGSAKALVPPVPLPRSVRNCLRERCHLPPG